MTNNDNWDDRDVINNNSKSGPAIIEAECRVGKGGKMLHYDFICGQLVNSPFRVTIHNYESEALGYDPTIKSKQNYYRFLHLSTLLNFPWGMNVKFRDDDGVVFGVEDVVRLLEERTEDAMVKWERDQAKFEKLQDGTAERVNIEYGKVVTTSPIKPIKHRGKSTKPGQDNAMTI